MNDSVRLDRWLWAARFYKSRVLAKTAIENGQILVAGQRTKPSRLIRTGDIIHIDKHGIQVYEVTVFYCANKRVSAAIAQTFYSETEAGMLKRIQLQEQHRIAKEMIDFPKQRPNKHDRRKIRAFRHKE